MALEAIDPRTFFTRYQLADTLEACGIPLSYDTLATKATRGGGPPFRIFGKSAVYQWADVVSPGSVKPWASPRAPHRNIAPDMAQRRRHRSPVPKKLPQW